MNEILKEAMAELEEIAVMRADEICNERIKRAEAFKARMEGRGISGHGGAIYDPEAQNRIKALIRGGDVVTGSEAETKYATLFLAQAVDEIEARLE